MPLPVVLGIDVAIERCDIDDKRGRWQVSNVVRGHQRTSG